MLADTPLPHGFGAALASVDAFFPRAPEQFVTSPLCLVRYVRWDARSDRVPPLQTIIFSSFPGRTPACRQCGSCLARRLGIAGADDRLTDVDRMKGDCARKPVFAKGHSDSSSENRLRKRRYESATPAASLSWRRKSFDEKVSRTHGDPIALGSRKRTTRCPA